MNKKVAIGVLAVVLFVGACFGMFWLGSENSKKQTQNKQVSENTSTSKTETKKVENNTSTNITETKKADKLYTLYSGDWGKIEIGNIETVEILNISDKIKEYLVREVSTDYGRGCGTKVVQLLQVYGDYAFAYVHQGGGLTNNELEARGCFGGGSKVLLGLKNGKVEELAGFQAVSTCAEKASWGAPEELVKDIPCDN
jgi:hypothetical protein